MARFLLEKKDNKEAETKGGEIGGNNREGEREERGMRQNLSSWIQPYLKI